jgi:hypothetical protein
MKHAKGDIIKVGLPGESLWAEVTHVGHVFTRAKLRNESIHEEFSFGDLVVIETGGYTVLQPARCVAAAQRSVDSFNRRAI